jgi:hypothetical protein
MIAAKSERKTAIVPIAMNRHGVRLPSLEKRLDEVYLAPLSSVKSASLNYGAFLHDKLEPTLFRELTSGDVLNTARVIRLTSLDGLR